MMASPSIAIAIGLAAVVSTAVAAQDSFTIQSGVLGEARLINVHTPPQYVASPTARLPVLYMPDGGLDEDFPHVVSAIDSLITLGRIRPVIVVGIPNTERRRDLTGPTRVGTDSAVAPHVGGSFTFRRFIREELIPEIERRYRTTPERAIVGESLAGLFVVETFLVDPRLFTHYVALDPSVWWNAGALVDSAASRIQSLDATRRSIYLATSREPSTSVGTTRLVELFRTVKPPLLRWRYEARPDLTHANIFRSVEAAALAHALR